MNFAKAARIPNAARFALKTLVGQIEALSNDAKRLERAIVAMGKHDPDIQRLPTILGVDAITVASIKALVPDISGFNQRAILPSG